MKNLLFLFFCIVSQAAHAVAPEVQNAVVSIDAVISEIDILRPFKTGTPYARYGSGFFIGREGYIATTAHLVDQAETITVRMPCIGRAFEARVAAISEQDIAVLKIDDRDLATIQSCLGAIPHLRLSDSDVIRTGDHLFALGHNGCEKPYFMHLSGPVFGREQNMIQVSCGLWPQSGGGPCVDADGVVVGINSSTLAGAANVSYMLPVKALKDALEELCQLSQTEATQVIRKPFLGVGLNEADMCESSDSIAAGAHVAELANQSPLAKAGVCQGDILSQIDGHDIDQYGQIYMPGSEEAISVYDYLVSLKHGQDVDLMLYRSGERMHLQARFEHVEQPPIRRMYPGYEAIDYEIFGGMVVCELSINHIQMLIQSAPGLAKYLDLNEQVEPVLVVTNIFQGSQLHCTHGLCFGATLDQINGVRVRTLADFREVLGTRVLKDKMFTIRAYDNMLHCPESVTITLPRNAVIKELPELAHKFQFELSPSAKDVLHKFVAATVVAEALGTVLMIPFLPFVK